MSALRTETRPLKSAAYAIWDFLKKILLGTRGPCTRGPLDFAHPIVMPLIAAGFYADALVWRDIHCESKKQGTTLLSITSPNIDRFSKFVNWQIH